MLLVNFVDKLVHKLLVSVEFLQQSSQPPVIDVQRWPANESHTSMVFNTDFSYSCCSSAPSSLFSPTQWAQKIRYHLQTAQACQTGHRKYGTISRQLRAVKSFSSHASSGPRRPALCIARIIAFSSFSSFCLPDSFSLYSFKFSASIKCRVAYTVNQTLNVTGWVVFRPDTTFAVDWVWVFIIKNRDPFPTTHHWTIQAQ